MSEETRIPNVSVIVPVYNTKEYLSKCFDSLCGQTLKEIEIILIDDGSNDGSGQICDEYAHTDARFQVIHKHHEGVAAARNTGLENVRAPKVMFVDSDDWVELDFCEMAYRTAEKTGADVVVFQRIRHEGNKAEVYAPYHYEGFISKEEALTKLWNEIGVVVWNKLYRTGLFDGIRYPNGRLSEDAAVTHRVIQRADSVYYLDKCLYHRMKWRPGSITTEKSVQLLEDEITFNVKRMIDLRKWGYDCGEEEKQLALRYLQLLGRKAELSSERSRIIRENRSGALVSRKQEAAAGLYRLSPVLFDLLAKLTGRRIR